MLSLFGLKMRLTCVSLMKLFQSTKQNQAQLMNNSALSSAEITLEMARRLVV